MTDESPETEGPGKTYRTRGALRPAQHRFLFLGILVIIGVAVILTFLNEKMKEETAFNEALQIQERSITATGGMAANLAYDEAPPQPEAPVANAVTPTETASPEPTISAPPSE